MHELLKGHNNTEVIAKSRLIQKSFETLKECSKDNIFLYVSKEGEVITLELIKRLMDRGKIVSIPAFDKDRDSMMPSRLINFEQDLELGYYGIYQPKEEHRRFVSRKSIDVAVVPGLAFDKRGCRLGRGKGYYDNFLESLSDNVSFVALAFEFQVLPSVPLCKRDMKIDKIITENRVIDCM